MQYSPSMLLRQMPLSHDKMAAQLASVTHRNVRTNLRNRVQGEGLVPLKLNEQDGGLIVARHGLCLVVQTP